MKTKKCKFRNFIEFNKLQLSKIQGALGDNSGKTVGTGQITEIIE